LNVALLNNIGDYLNDAHGMHTDGKQLTGNGGAILRGLTRNEEDKARAPVYKLKI